MGTVRVIGSTAPGGPGGWRDVRAPAADPVAPAAPAAVALPAAQDAADEPGALVAPDAPAAPAAPAAGTTPAAVAAWALAGLIAVAVTLDTVFTAAHRPLLSESTWADHRWPLITLAGAGCALMGALIVSRYPRQPLGWLLCAASLISVTQAAEAYSIWVLDGDGPGSAHWAHVTGWVSELLGWPAFTALIMIFLISPDGHLLSPRWRWAVRVSVAGLAVHTLGSLTTRPGEFRYREEAGYRAISLPLMTIGWMLVAAGLIASAVSLVLRLRRARDDIRRQLLWIASSATFLAVGVVVILVVPRFQDGRTTWLAALPLGAAYLAFPLCVAVAVLRHRLFEIDLIVNRALVLAMASVLVAAGYVAVVVLLGTALGGGDDLWVSLVATALVAMAFQPLRRRVVGIADRLAYGQAAAPYEALAEFGRRLGDTPDTSALLPAVAEAVTRAVNASRTTVRLLLKDGPDGSATWPTGAADGPAAAAVEFPVVHAFERLGSITVAMPAGRALRQRDVLILKDLAEHAGTAFRNAGLSAELSGRVEQLGDRTRELAESRRRLITAGDAERIRLERSLARQVLLHLAPIPDRLRQLSRVEANDLGLYGDVVALVGSSTAALAGLREITRGVFPAQLARTDLPTALRSLLAQPGAAGRLVVEQSAIGRRSDPRVTSAAYFCVAEAARDLRAPVLVRLSATCDELNVVVSGREGGGLPLGQMRDRVEAAGGSVSMSGEGGNTHVDVRLPVPTGELRR